MKDHEPGSPTCSNKTVTPTEWANSTKADKVQWDRSCRWQKIISFTVFYSSVNWINFSMPDIYQTIFTFFFISSWCFPTPFLLKWLILQIKWETGATICKTNIILSTPELDDWLFVLFFLIKTLALQSLFLKALTSENKPVANHFANLSPSTSILCSSLVIDACMMYFNFYLASIQLVWEGSLTLDFKLEAGIM